MAKHQLINFKVNPTIKNEFQKICEHHNMRMSSVLNLLINEFISRNKLEEDTPLEFFSDHQNRF
jgi:addiction module RelB/DinJ family antitoxin